MKKILIICVAAAAFCAAVYFFLRPSAAPIYWQKDVRQMYEFDYSNDVSYSLPFGDMTGSGRQIISGIINMRVFDAGNEFVKIGLQISPVKIYVAGKNIAELEKLLSSFFLAELSPDGRFSRFYFDPGVSKEDEKLFTSIVQSFQFIIKPGGPSEWNSREEDSTGEYRSVYTVKKNYVVKKKLEYRKINNAGFSMPRNSDMQAVIGENSKLIIHYGKPVSWIHSARGFEKIDFLLNNKRMASSTVTTYLKLTDYVPDNNIGIWQNDKSFDSIALNWKSGGRREGSFWKDIEIRSLKEKYKGKNFHRLIKDFTVTRKIVPWESISSMRDYLTVNPLECGRVSEYLLAGTLNSVQQAALIHVLELVGHRDAQMALVNIMNNKSHSLMNRARSIIALCGVSDPADESVDNLLAVYKERGGNDAVELSDTAVLGLGNISHTQERKTGNDDADKRRNKINDFLLKEFADNTSDNNKKAVLLSAIGNTRDGVFFDAIKTSMNDENARVRASAVRAVVAIGDVNAAGSVVDRLSVEKEKAVKTAIMDSLCDKPGMDSAVRFITDSIGDERDPGVRKSMLRYLIKNRDAFPDIKNTLQKMLDSEPDPQNIKLIYQGLYSKQKL